MAIIQQGQKRDNRVQNMAALANIVMQVLQYKQQQDAVAYNKAQQEGYGKDVAGVLKPYRQLPPRIQTPSPEHYADEFLRSTDELKGMSREQFNSKPVLPTAQKAPILPRYNIKREQIPGIQASLLEAGARRPRPVRIDPLQLSGMFDSAGGRSGGSGARIKPLTDDQYRVGLLNTRTGKIVGGHPDFEWTAAKGLTFSENIPVMRGQGIPTQASVQARQRLREANEDTIEQAAKEIKKMKNYHKLSFNGRQQLLREYLAKQGFRMPPVSRK